MDVDRHVLTATLLTTTLAVLFVFTLGIFLLPGSIEFQGNQDFIAYYTAWHLWSSGGNPYDATSMSLAQIALGRTPTDMLNIFRYFPGFLALMSPVLAWSYPVARWLWCSLNIGFAVATVAICWDNIAPRRVRPVWCGLIVLLFFPLWDALGEGQLGIFMGFAIALLAHGLRNHTAALSALGCLMLAPKPHLVAPLGAYLCGGFLRQRRILFCLLGFIISSCAIAELLKPGIHLLWLQSSDTTPPFVKTVTLPSFFTAWLPQWFAGREYPFIQVAEICVCATALYLGIRTQRLSQSFAAWAPYILLIGLLISPLTWISDLNILLPVLGLAAGALAARGQQPWLILAFEIAVYCVLALLSHKTLADFVWLPLIIVGVYQYAVAKQGVGSPP